MINLTYMILLNIIFIYSNHLVMMSMILMTQLLIISIFMGLNSMTFWFSYIIFMVIIGSVMIMFIYMTSLISNKKFNKNYWFFISLLMIIPMNINLMIYNNNNKEMMKLNINYLTNEIYKNLNKLFMENKNLLMLFLSLYLLIMMLIVNKMINIKKGPLMKI
uniref:NADH dehydrogenase subunit 6 n=1 Tax=Dipterophagus daci TaxID=2800156 RepID=UPI001D11F845|nr:NADH dehydrogenase subunit 6 [Dipterophagus daci]QZO77422.1 NADH dehydrogenase subunit 6 [Dipterophagus daci]